MENKAFINFMQDFIFESLDEMKEEMILAGENDFLWGKIYGYLECLEIILEKIGVDNDIILDIEKHYGIR